MQIIQYLYNLVYLLYQAFNQKCLDSCLEPSAKNLGVFALKGFVD